MTSKPTDQQAQSTRPAMERMLYIHKQLLTGTYPNAPQMARALEVHPKSIRRDVDFMRDRLLLPIEYEPYRQGYYYSKEVSAFPTMQITEGELFALLVAEKALQQYRGTTFEKPLLSAINKLASSLPNTISLNMSEWERTISFRTSAEPILNLEVLERLARATSEKQQLLVNYRKPGMREGEDRIMDPYHLANINGEWFLFAFDHGRQDMRTFVPARMLRIELTGKTFERSPDFSLEKRLRDSFGVRSADGEFEVVVRFTPKVADYIREKKWHASQELVELDTGGVELRVKLSSLVEIERWLLQWGDNVIVVKPQALAESIQETARKIVENYKAK